MKHNKKMITGVCIASALLTSIPFNVYADSEPEVSSSILIDFDKTSEFDSKITPDVKKKSDNIKIRTKAKKDAEVIGYLEAGGSADIIRQYDDWTLIKSGDIQGWVKTSSICSGYKMNNYIEEKNKLFDKVATVKANVLRVRENANISSNITNTVEKGEELPVLADKGNWVKIDIGNDSGFVSKDFITTRIKFGEAKPIENNNEDNNNESENNNNVDIDWSKLPENSDCNNELRKDLIEYAYSKLGSPYVYGGESYTTGIDCSAYMQDIYRHFGMSLPRTSRGQAALTDGISLEDIQPGDLLFYISKYTGKVGHVTMYIGDGKVIHASNPSDGIKISDIGYRTPCKIINMVKYFGRD